MRKYGILEDLVSKEFLESAGCGIDHPHTLCALLYEFQFQIRSNEV